MNYEYQKENNSTIRFYVLNAYIECLNVEVQFHVS